MKEELDSQKFTKQAEELYKNALEATIELLKNNPKGRYIVIPNWDDEVDTTSLDDVFISIYGVGLNTENHICVKAKVDYVGYGHTEEDFPKGWTGVDEIHPSSYPDIYRFVVDNITAATDKATADAVKWDEE